MRPLSTIFLTAALCALLAARASHAQQADSLLPQHLSPITIEQPRAFSPPNAIQARPIPANPSYQPPPAANSSTVNRQPPVNVRLVASEEAVGPTSNKPPLRLAP